jgi:hypothetical protein
VKRYPVGVGATLFAAGMLLAGLVTTPNARVADKPNILFILMDNLGYGEPGVYGGGIVRGAPSRASIVLRPKGCD